MAKLGNAAIVWTDSGTGTERVLLLDVPLRELRPGFTQTAFTAESLDKTAIQTITVGNGAYELVGSIRYEDDPEGLLDMVRFGAVNTTLTYLPSLSDPDLSYSVKLISPRDVGALTMDLDSQRPTFGEHQVEVRFRKTDQTAFTEPFEGTNVLFAYRAGDNLAKGTFSRADTATHVSKGYGTVTSASSGKARIHWMDTDSDGIRETPTLLLEGASTNLIVESSNFGATWTQTSVTVTGTQADPMGGTSASSISDASAVAAGSVSITPTFTTDAVSKALSVFVKAGTATTTVLNLRDTTAGADRLLVTLTWSNGVPTAVDTTGTTLSVVRHTNGWYRILCRTTAVAVANTNTVFLYPAGTVVANTGTCLFFGVQAENALNPTSYIPTAGGTDTRVTDSLTFPFTPRVQTMTLYARYFQNGTLPYASGTTGVFSVGNISGASTAVRVANTGGSPNITAALTDSAGTTSAGGVAPGAAHGQLVELVVWVRVTASTKTATIQAQAALQGVIGTAGSVSSAKGISDNFQGAVVVLGTLGGSAAGAPFPFTHVGIMRGVQDMFTLRRVLGV